MFVGRVKKVRVGKYVTCYLKIDGKVARTLKPRKVRVRIADMELLLDVKKGSKGYYAKIPTSVIRFVDDKVEYEVVK